MNEENEHRLDQEESGEYPKKEYIPPILIIHGSLEELTKDLGLEGSDGLLGSYL